MKLKCKKCNSELAHNCGDRLEKKSRFFIIICLVISIIIVSLCVYEIPLIVSNKNFEKAIICEENKNYEEALDFYKSVIPRDESNYSSAKIKIDEIELILNNCYFVADCIRALNNEVRLNKSSITEIYADFNLEKCALKINGVGYLITKQKIEYEDYVVEYFNAESQYHIVEYKAPYVYNGFSTNLNNSLRQETSNALYEIQKVVLDELNIDIALNYVNLN